MEESLNHCLQTGELPQLKGGTLLLSFSGWMDGGQASTGTVSRFIEQLEAEQFAEIDFEPFYILNVPGSMEISALFRPEIAIDEGLVRSISMPENLFYSSVANNLLLFTGQEPNLRWRTFGDCIVDVAKRTGVKRLMFVGSFGGAVPHTREPRMYVTCSEERLHEEMRPFGMRRTAYDGPGSFMTYLMTRAPDAGLEMVSLVAEIPGYLQGSNPFCIEAITRRLAAILKLPLDVDELRSASNDWEEHISSLVEENEDMVERIRQLEDRYDRELLEMDDGDV